MKDEEMITIAHAAAQTRISRQAVAIAIKSGRINGIKINGIWHVTQKEWNKYNDSKYSRERRRYNGQQIYNEAEGRFSFKRASQIISKALGVPYEVQRLYYLYKKDKIVTFRKGSALVIPEDAITFLIQMERENLKKKKRRTRGK